MIGDRMKQETLEGLSKQWLWWFGAYFLTGAIAMMSSQTSFLATPVDYPLPLWFKLVFLNVPLQLWLALIGTVMINRDAPYRWHRTATLIVSSATTLLISINLITALWFLAVD